MPSPNSKTGSQQSPSSLFLTIRFSASLPDLDLDISSPDTVTVIALKHLIRSYLQPPHNSRRLRCIYQGKILADGSSLGSSLGWSPTPESLPSGEQDDPKGKGKAVEVLTEDIQRTYLICSIGDALTAAELSSEASAAQQTPSEPGGSSTTAHKYGPTTVVGAGRASSSAQAPRGFDRLLATGFTTSEVSQLRLQFRDIHAQRHTPDTMPSPDTLRSMEDIWMDANAGDAVPGGSTTTPGGATLGAAAPDDALGAMHEQLDGLVKGMMMGFFWPMGGIAWLTREGEMVSQRWRVWIGFGVSFSVIIGVMRTLFGGEQ